MQGRMTVLFASVVIASVIALPTAPARAETPDDQGPALSVVEIVVSSGFDRETRRPIGAAERFDADTESLWCYTRITGALQPLNITHVWYHEGETRSRIYLPVHSADWRTWSSKGLLPAWTGRWVVKVLDPDGLVLATRSFIVGPPETGGEETE
jgi:hypothetical protein